MTSVSTNTGVNSVFTALRDIGSTLAPVLTSLAGLGALALTIDFLARGTDVHSEKQCDRCERHPRLKRWCRYCRSTPYDHTKPASSPQASTWKSRSSPNGSDPNPGSSGSFPSKDYTHSYAKPRTSTFTSNCPPPQPSRHSGTDTPHTDPTSDPTPSSGTSPRFSSSRPSTSRVRDKTLKADGTPRDNDTWKYNGLVFLENLYHCGEAARTARWKRYRETASGRSPTDCLKELAIIKDSMKGSQLLRDELWRNSKWDLSGTSTPSRESEWKGLKYVAALNRAALSELQSRKTTATARMKRYSQAPDPTVSEREELVKERDEIYRLYDRATFVDEAIDSRCSAQGWSQEDLLLDSCPPSTGKRYRSS